MITTIQGVRTLIQAFFVFGFIVISLLLFTMISLPLFTVSLPLFTASLPLFIIPLPLFIISLTLFPFLLFYYAMKLLKAVINLILDHFDPSHS